MELTDITKEKERKMQKNEKQVIAVLAAAIAVVAVILIAMLVTSRDTTDNESASTSLKNAVQEETNNKKNNEGKDVGDGNVADSTDDNTTEAQTTTEASDSDTKSASEIMDADTEYISKSDIKKLSDSELQYAVNEIYARHGLKFTKKVNKERFEKKAWYNGTVDDQDSISLNKYEKKNVDTMAAELKKRGLR